MDCFSVETLKAKPIFTFRKKFVVHNVHLWDMNHLAVSYALL